MLPQKSIDIALETMKNGGIVLHPTDTLWSLGCDPWNEVSVLRLHQIKSHDQDNPLLLLVDSIDTMKQFVPAIHPRIETLLSYHKRPLTLFHPKHDHVPRYLLAEDGSIGIRIINDGICHMLIKAFGKPLVSSSPNLAGQPIPKKFGAISSAIIGKVDYVLMEERATRIESDLPVSATYDNQGELNFY